MTERPKRRWYQFHLWHLFLLLTVVAIACSWFVCVIEKARRREEVMLWLRRSPPRGLSPYPEERSYYCDGDWRFCDLDKAYSRWLQAGSRIDDLEDRLLHLLGEDENQNKEKEFMSTWIVHALGYVGKAKSERVLVGILRDEEEDPDMRQEAMSSLATLRSKRAVPVLCNVARTTEDHDLSMSAMSALGYIGDPRAKPCLEELLQRREWSELERRRINIFLDEVSGQSKCESRDISSPQ